MALTGQLSDMSLAELIEFFCNQRKTGRLKIDSHRGHGLFFIKNGELVDAKVGSLSGTEAVYFALTMPNAAFDFSSDFEPLRRTIQEPWTQVVLEGLRRLDEGVSPSEAEAFRGVSDTHSLDEEDLLPSEKSNQTDNVTPPSKASVKQSDSATVPFAIMVDSTTRTGGKKWMTVGAVVCVVMVCAVVAIPLSGRFGKSNTASPNSAALAPVAAQPEASAEPSTAPTPISPADASTGGSTPTDDAAAVAARREARERELMRARKAEDLARKAAAGDQPTPAVAGPKSVKVSVMYDDAGRVTQASVAGSSPGAEAYAGTAVRIARGKRFPAGKAGSTVVTIPIN